MQGSLKCKSVKGVLLWPLIALIAVFTLCLSPLTAQAADYDPAKEQIHVIVMNNTFPESEGAAWDGILLDTWVDIDSSSTMMSCIVAALDEYGYEQEGAEDNYITSVGGLAAFDGGSDSGWMMLCNDWFINSGAGDFTVANGAIGPNDEIEVCYSRYGWGEDLGGSFYDNDKTLKALNFSDGELSPAFSSDGHAYTLTLPASVNKVRVVPTASNKNFLVKTYLGDQATGTEYKRTLFIPVKDGDVLTIVDGDPAWPSMNGGDWGTADSVPAETYTVNVVVESATPGWHQDDNGNWYYINDDGTLATNKWVKDSKGWCYLDDNGRMIYNNFAPDSKGDCYVGSNGYMDTSTKWVQVGGYWYHITKGYKDTNKWMKDSKGWCFLGDDGKMVTDTWKKDSKGWCYVGSDGYMVTSAFAPDSHGDCWLGSGGYMDTGTKWIKYDGDWYHITKGYKDTNNWFKDSKGWCYVGDDGKMVTNDFAADSKGMCYIGSDGYMITATKWVKVGDDWYHVTKGYMDKSQWYKDSKGWCYVGDDGKMVTNGFAPDSHGMCYIGDAGYMVEEDMWIGDEFAEGSSYIIQGYRVDDQTIEIDGIECTFDADGKYVPVPVKADVDFSAQMSGAFLFAPAKGVEVSSDLAESYGYADDVPYGKSVSALDVMVAACQLTFGSDFTAETASDYLVVGSSGFVTTYFGVETGNNGWMFNDGYPNDGTESPYGGYNGTTVKNQMVATGDKVDFFTIEDTDYWSDLYSWLDAPAYVTPSEEFEVEGVAHYFTAGYNYATADEYKAAGSGDNLEDCGLAWVDASTGALTPIDGVAFDEDGVATVTAPAEEGTYWLTASGFGGMLGSPVIMNPIKVTVAAPASEFAYDGDAVTFIGADGSEFGMYRPQEGTTIFLDGDNVVVHYIPKNKTVYKGFFLGADILFSSTWDEGSYFTFDAGSGCFDFTLPKSYCGKAWPIVPNKVSDPTATTSSQYYLAIPAEDKISPVQKPVTATVDFTAQMDGAFLFGPAKGTEVSSDLAESYGFADSVPLDESVSTLDVLVAANIATFGTEDFSAAPSEYLVVENGGISKIFGAETYNCGFAVNGQSPYDESTTFPAGYGFPESYAGYNVAQVSVASGDFVEFFVYQDSSALDYYTWFTDASGKRVAAIEVAAGEEIDLNVMGYIYAYYGAAVDEELRSGDAIVDSGDVEDLPIVMIDEFGAPIEFEPAVAADEDGAFTISFAEPGTYTIAVQGDEYVPVLSSLLRVTVTAPAPQLIDIKDATVTLSPAAALYTGEPVDWPTITVTYNGETLVAERDYMVVLLDGGTSDGTTPGTILFGIGGVEANGYTGSQTATFTIQEPAEEFAYNGDAVTFINKDGGAFKMFAAQEGTTVSIEGDNVVIHYVPKTTTTYVGFYVDADILSNTTWNSKPYFALTNGAFDITLPKSYCGKAWPVAPVKSDGNTTGTQYYLAIPAAE